MGKRFKPVSKTTSGLSLDKNILSPLTLTTRSFKVYSLFKTLLFTSNFISFKKIYLSLNF